MGSTLAPGAIERWNADGRVLVVWQDSPADVVRGRFLTVPGITALFDDGFESGETDGWDLVTPVP